MGMLAGLEILACIRYRDFKMRDAVKNCFPLRVHSVLAAGYCTSGHAGEIKVH